MSIQNQAGARLRYQVRLALLGTTLAVTAPGAMAAMITVNSNGDMSSDSECTLRDAITAANTDQATGGCATGDATGDTIVFGDSVAGSTITLGGNALPTVMAGSTLMIGAATSQDDDGDDSDSDNSDSSAGVTIDANQMSRIFTNQGDLTLNGLTLVNGQTMGGDAGADDRSGGAILNDDGGVLTVNGGAMNNNTSDRAGGAIEEASGADADTTAVTLNNVDFSGNDAGMNPGNGGVLHVTGAADVMVDGGTFDSNTAVEGGALWNNGGTMSVTGAMFTNNSATGGDTDNADQGGGALFANTAGGALDVSDSRFDSNTAGGDVSSGGAIFVNEGAMLTLSNSTLTNNTANRAGGAIELRDGSSATLNQVNAAMNTANTTAGGGGGNGGVVHVTGAAAVDVTGGVYARNTAVEGGAFWNNQGEMSFDGVSIVGNEATGADADQGGGGIFGETNSDGASSGTLTINNTRISGNSASGAAGSGGGIQVLAGATANITDSRIFANTANRAGGGIESASGIVTLMNVTLGGADGAGNNAGASPGNGGGLHVGGTGTTTLTNSTVGNNIAKEGGGLWNNVGSTMTVDNSTVSSNTADRGAGIYLNGDGAAVALDFASVTNNNGTGIESGTAATGGTVNVDGSSLVANNTTDDIGDNVTVTPMDSVVTGTVTVGEYRLFGGTTATQPLTADSTMALDTNACDATEMDQRGASRNFDAVDPNTGAGDCDSGAFELTDDPVLTVIKNGPDTATANGSDAPSVVGFTLTNDEAEATTVAGFSGYINRGSDTGDDSEIPAGFNLAGAQLTVYGDTNANGTFDSGENEVGSGTVDDNGSTFTITFTGGGALIPANDSMSYVVIAELAEDDATMPVASIGSLMPVYAGGALLGLVGLLSVGGVRRRTQMLLIVAALALALTACNSDDDANVNVGGNNGGMDNGNDGGMDGGNNGGMAMGQAQFVVDQLTASDADDLVIGDNLPINGPSVTFAVGDSDDMSSDN